MAILDERLDNDNYTANDTAVKDAVNELLESIGELPVSTSPTTSSGASIYNRALRFLERANVRTQAMMWPENTALAKRDTVTNLIGSAGLALAVRAAGEDSHRSFVVRESSGNQIIFDSDAGAAISGGTTIQVDMCTKVPFKELSYHLRENIIKSAAQEFQRRLQGSPQADQMLAQERIFADGRTSRPEAMKKNAPLRNAQSPFSSMPAPPQTGTQDG
tara:strand:- start:532 stop:1185 length:654 start_codon:yes stop_codon:yes gene_type:complete